MTNGEAREILGFKKSDILLKTGLAEFRKAYKKWLKDPNISKEIRAVVQRDLEAVEILMNEGG